VRRFILTGAPGSGKTSILRALADMGYAVVEESATDANTAALARGEAEPWTDPLFIDRIVRLQHLRLAEPVPAGAAAQVHDRSAVCTLALARWLGRPVTATLRGELAEITGAGTFDRRVFSSARSGSASPPRCAGSVTPIRCGSSAFTNRSTGAWGSRSWTSRPVRSASGLR
jgi:predicted ATPase